MTQTAIPAVNYKADTIESLQKEVALAREKNDTHNLILLLKKLGLAYIENGDAPQALSEFDEGLKLVATGADKEAFAQFLGLRGLALKLLGNFSLAMQAFRKSNKVAIEIKHPALTVDSFIQIAGLYTDLEKPENALTSLDSALSIAIEQKDKVRKMRVNGLMGDHFSRQPDPKQAKQYFQAAYEIALDLENHGAECSFITKLGNAFLLEGNIESAIEKYERALKLASALDDRNAEINILGGLFRAHALDKNIQLASIYGEKVITLAREFKHAEAEISNIVAFTSFLADHGKVSDTIPYLVRGIQIADDQNSLNLKLDMLVRLGLASYQEGHYDLALEHFDTAFVIAGNVSDEITQMLVLSYIASVYADMEQYENSIATSTKAMALAERLEDHRLTAEQQILLAFNYRDLGEGETATQYCSAALESFKKLEDQAMVTQAQVLLEELSTTRS